MIHYSCDRCRKTIDPKEEIRYVIKLDAHAALEPIEAEEIEDDRDYLGEIQDILEGMDDEDVSLHEPQACRSSYDLCPECFRKFMQNPLGCDAHAHIGFSPN